MSEREYRLDVCPECKVRERDSSKKKLYLCPYCQRWFCERHFEPKVVYVPDYSKIIKDAAWRDVVEKDRKREDGHPDFAYTEERMTELEIERELMWAEIDASLKKSRAYRKITEEEPKILERLVACSKCGSTKTMTTAYREEFEAFECLSCHYTWKEGKDTNARIYGEPVIGEKERKLSFVKEESPYRLIPVQPKPRSHKVRNAVIVVSLWAVLLIGLVLFIRSPEFNIGIFSSYRVPIASFIPSKNTDIFTGEKIIFNASSSYDPDNSQGKGIVTYRWNFGDGKPIETVSNYTITHSYALVKTYNVTLTVIDDDGQNATYVRSIEVKWEVPTVSQLRNWLTIDKTNQMTYHYPDFVCFNFSKMLASHSRQENWKMALVLIYGYDTSTNQQWNHAINTINTTEGVVYIEPQTDEVWWLNNYAKMVSGNTYNFWSYPYQTVSVHIKELLVLHLEDLDKYQFIPSNTLLLKYFHG